jgi:dipeptidyl aminopeptidase/acylaminoacyl peptidase
MSSVIQVLVLVGGPFLGADAWAAPPLAVYGSLPGFERAAISPTGNHVALVGTANGQRLLLVVDATGKAIFSAKLGEQKLRQLQWAGESQVLLWVSETKSLGPGFTTRMAELTAALVINIENGKSWWVFEKNSNVGAGVRGFYGIAQREGRWYGYFGGLTLEGTAQEANLRIGNTNAELYEVDLTDGRTARIARRQLGEAERSWLVGADGRVAAQLEFEPRDGRWRISNAAGKTIAQGINPLGGVQLIAFGAAPETLIYSSENEATGVDRWLEVSQQGGEAREIFADEAIARIFIEPQTRRLIGFEREGDRADTHLLEAGSKRAMSAAREAFADREVRLIDWSENFEKLLVKTDGDGDPGTWWIVDLKSGEASDLGQSYPIAATDVGPVKMFDYKAADGLPLRGVLTLPPKRTASKLPVIVLPHGGPAARDYPRFDWWAQALASRGYAVFQPNFRGSAGFGAVFLRAGHGEWGRKVQSDISDGLAELERQGIVDARRACIMGASFGGYAALAGVTLQQGLYRCAVSVAGIGDLVAMVNSDLRGAGEDPVLARALAAEVGSGRNLREISPVNAADRADAPILLIHGKQDTVVLFEQSRIMERALRRADKPVELITLDGEDHWLSRGSTRLAMLQAAVAFVERHNPPN